MESGGTRIKNEGILRSIETSPKLSDASKRKYLGYLNRLKGIYADKKLVFSLYNIYCSDPEKLEKVLTSAGVPEKTQYTYVSIVAAAMKNTKVLVCSTEDNPLKWKKYMRSKTKKIWSNYGRNALTERQISGHVPMNELKSRYDELIDSSPIKIYLSFYLYPSKWAIRSGDLWGVRLYENEPKRAPKNTNYIVVSTHKLILVDYKTSRIYERKEFDLNDESIAQVRALVDSSPGRAHLFLNRQNNPYTSRNSFHNWIQGALKRFSGNENFHATLFRKEHVTSLGFQTLTNDEKDEVASNMCNSSATCERFYYVKDDAVN